MALSYRRLLESGQDPAEEVVADRLGIDHVFDGEPVGQREDDRDELLDVQPGWARVGAKRGADGVGDRGAQRPTVGQERGSHRVVCHSTSPEVQEQQLPFALADERAGEPAADLVQGVWSLWPRLGGERGVHGVDPGQDLVVQVAHTTGSDYELVQHQAIATAVGGTGEQLALLAVPAAQRTPTALQTMFTPAQQAVVAATDEIVRSVRAEEATVHALRRYLSDR